MALERLGLDWEIEAELSDGGRNVLERELMAVRDREG
jgi:hypothetical protein